MELAYPFNIKEESGEYLINFPDIPEAITSASSQTEALTLASDALIAALGGYMEERRVIPTPSARKADQQVVYLRPLEAAKIALYIAMKEEGTSNIALANRLNIDEKAVRRMLDLDHATKIETIHKVLQSVFSKQYCLVTSIQPITNLENQAHLS